MQKIIQLADMCDIGKEELLEMFNPQVKGYLNDNIINK